MFYRQASTGQVPGSGWRRATPRAPSTSPRRSRRSSRASRPPGTLAETELRLRLYHGPARFDLIVKDYQGEHVTLGTDEPIQEFFADCDAVLLCLDPEGSSDPADRRRRQQEVENLLERYIDRSDDGTAGRPVALLLTKFDRVLADAPVGQMRRRPASRDVERLVDRHYGMTRHAPGAARPPGRDLRRQLVRPRRERTAGPPPSFTRSAWKGPLGWLAEQLEAGDRGAARMALGPRPRRPAPALPLRRRLREALSPVGPRRAVPRRLDELGAAGEGGWPSGSRRSRRSALVVRWRATTPGDTTAPWRSSATAKPRAGRRAAVVGGAGVASVAPAVLARPRARRGRRPGRVDRQGGGASRSPTAPPRPTSPRRSTGLKDQAPSSSPAIRKVEDAQEPRPARRALEGRPGRGPRRRRRPRAALIGRPRRSSRSSPTPPHRDEALALLASLKAQADAEADRRRSAGSSTT